MKFIRAIFVFLIRWIILPIVLIGLHLWSFGALYYSPIQPELLRAWIAAVYGIGVPLAVLVSRSRKWAVILPVAGYLCVLSYEWHIQPKTDAVYQPQVERAAYAKVQGDTIVFHNVRNSTYRTVDDFDAHYETREYDLKRLRTLDLFLNYWGVDNVAHVFISFGFTDGRYLAVSVEYRPEVGEKYGTFNGLFKQYELIYVWSDERDVARLRTNYRKENVYLYRMKLTPEQVQKLFLAMIKRTNAIQEKPEFYNTITDSCTSSIANHIIQEQVVKVPFWKRRILNGTLDRRMYQEGFLERYGRSFSELRTQSNVDARAQAADQAADFSARIRSHLIEADA